MLQAGAAFIECVKRGTPPEEAEPIKLSIDGVERVAVKADERIAWACARLVELKAAIKPAEAEAEELTAALKAYMGPATELLGPGGETLATYRPSKAGGLVVDTKALEKAHPEIVKQFTRPKAAARPLLLK